MSGTKEENIGSELAGRFPYLEGKIRVQRARRIWVDAPADKFDEVFKCLTAQMAFGMVCAVTGQDEGGSFSFIYHLAKEDGTVLNLKTSISKANPKWKSIGAMFPGAIIYEREIADLFGVEIEGLPPGPRYPLPDGWPAGQYPLRKDWQGANALPKEGGGA
jgi:membrane-bound hydrogenase subunit beta